MKLIAVTVSLLTILVLGAGWRSTSSPTEQRWEYMIVGGDGGPQTGAGAKQSDFTWEEARIERNLDKLGAQGWELVSVMVLADDGTLRSQAGKQPQFYLKRLKP